MNAKNIIPIIIFFLVIWGLGGLLNGDGFFGGIFNQFFGAYLILKLVGVAVIIYLLFILIIRITNSKKND